MPTKSSNQHGNPWHDDEGKFTSKSGPSEIIPELEDIFRVEQGQKNEVKLDLDEVLSFIDQTILESQNQPATVKDYEKSANQNLFDGNYVVRLDGCTPEQAKMITDTIKRVKEQFPLAFRRLRIFGVGDKNSSAYSKWEDTYKYQIKKLAEERYEKIKYQYPNLTAEALYNNWINKKGNPIHKGGWVYGNSITGAFTLNTNTGIMFNPYMSLDEINKMFNARKQIHGEAGDEIEWMCYHEMGHLITNLFRYDPNFELRAKEMKKLARKASSVGQKVSSAYGLDLKSNVVELFSEAFADVMCYGEQATSINKDCVKIMKEFYEEYAKGQK